MHFKQVDRGELIAVVGGILLGISLLLSWYTLGEGAGTTVLGGCHGPRHGAATGCSGWDALQMIRFLLLIAAAAPAILVYIVIRGHALSWPRGELTAVTALTALTLIVFRGLIDKPGTPSGEIGLDIGWGVALVGGLLILAGSIWRAQESAARRKPPGVL